MAKYRRDRINDEMQRAVADIMRGVKDPRVSEAFISITGAEVTADLKYAKIYYSALSATTPEKKKAVAAGLRSSVGFIRGQVSKKLNLRITPELTFVEDTSIKYGAHISEILNGLTFSDDNGTESPEENTKEDNENDN